MATKKELQAHLRGEKALLARLTSGIGPVRDETTVERMITNCEREIKKLEELLTETSE